MIKAILFNINGTIINTLRADEISKKSIAEKHGMVFDQGFHQINHGDQDFIYWEKFVNEFGFDSDPAQLTTESKKLYNTYAPHYNSLYPDTQEFIERCKDSDIKIGICSNSDKTKITQSLSLFGLDLDFEHILSGEDVSEGKPSPEGYELLANVMEIKLDQSCLILENSPTGLTAAIQTGAVVVQVDHSNDQTKIKEAAYHMTERSKLIETYG